MLLSDYLPTFLTQSKIFSAVLSSEQAEINRINLELDDLLQQCFVSTATWGLGLWEDFVGIKTDVSKSDASRREQILAKIRGVGTVTKQMIKNTAAVYSNGDVDVIEDAPNYRFTIKFVGTLGIPANMDGLAKTIEEIKPAHLSYTFEYVFITWDDFESYNKTLDEWDALNLTWDEFEVYKG